jgi:ribosomal protein L15
MCRPVMGVWESTASILEVVVLLVVSIITGASTSVLPEVSSGSGADFDHRTNMDKYHPGYFGKVGMRHFHLTRNKYWRPAINVDKLWSLVPAEEKKGLKEDSEVVPVIDALRHGYGKVLGNGRCVSRVVCTETYAYYPGADYQNCPLS